MTRSPLVLALGLLSTALLGVGAAVALQNQPQAFAPKVAQEPRRALIKVIHLLTQMAPLVQEATPELFARGGIDD